MLVQDRVIVSLDVDAYDRLGELVEQLRPLGINRFVVGKQLAYRRSGRNVCATLSAVGCRVLYDGKEMDDAAAMVDAVDGLIASGVEAFTVLAEAGATAMRAVAECKGNRGMFVCTVPRTMSYDDCYHVNGCSAGTRTVQLAYAAMDGGADGLILSHLGLKALPDSEFDAMLKVCDGVRSSWAGGVGEAGVVEPYDAMLAGADAIIVGDPITAPPACAGGTFRAAQRILADMEAGLSARNRPQASVAIRHS